MRPVFGGSVLSLVAALLLPAELGTTPRGGERLLIPHRRSPAPPSTTRALGENPPLWDRSDERSRTTAHARAAPSRRMKGRSAGSTRPFVRYAAGERPARYRGANQRVRRAL